MSWSTTAQIWVGLMATPPLFFSSWASTARDLAPSKVKLSCKWKVQRTRAACCIPACTRLCPHPTPLRPFAYHIECILCKTSLGMESNSMESHVKLLLRDLILSDFFCGRTDTSTPEEIKEQLHSLTWESASGGRRARGSSSRNWHRQRNQLGSWNWMRLARI